MLNAMNDRGEATLNCLFNQVLIGNVPIATQVEKQIGQGFFEILGVVLS